MPIVLVDQQPPVQAERPAPQNIQIEVDRDGQIYFDGKPVTEEELKQRLAAISAQKKRDREKR